MIRRFAYTGRMTPQELRDLASQLGPRWQTKLARLIPCTARHVRYMLKGERPIRPITERRVREIVRKHKKTRISSAR